MIKKAIKSVENKDKAKAEEYAKKVIKSIDKAIQAGVIKKNTGARQKSRLMSKVNKIKETKKEEK